MPEGQGFRRVPYLAKLPLENDGHRKLLPDKQNLREFISTNLSLEEILF
jgi:hypothetical protein